MADEQQSKIENLELNRETLQDLTDLETEAAEGGQIQLESVVSRSVRTASGSVSGAQFISSVPAG
jgi:hypothetical protein